MTVQVTWAQAGLTILCLVLLTVTILVLAAPVSDWTPPAVHAEQAAQASEAANTFAPPPLDTFSALNARPVFNPARTPLPSADDAPDDESSGSLADLTLVGIISDGGAKLAIIRRANHPLATSVAAGADIEGWRVSRIEGDRVVLRGKGGERELRIQRANPLPGAASGQ